MGEKIKKPMPKAFQPQTERLLIPESLLAPHVRWLPLIVALGVSAPCQAEDVFIAGVVSGGPVLGDESGRFVTVAGYAGLGLLLTAGAERKVVNDEHLNVVYGGIGLATFLQAHIGASNQGALYRIRSEFAPFALLQGEVYPRARDDKLSLSRLMLSLTYEDTFRDKGLSNYTFGLGYCFSLNTP
jgi:hypothetical protein